jgi:uncharacterized membrane protein
MRRCGNLWAVGYDDTRRAAEVRDELTRLAWEKHKLVLLDVAVAVRYPDGVLTLNGEPFQASTHVPGGPVARFLASLALGAPPLTGASVGLMFECVGAAAVETGISDDFVRQVEGLINPGTSMLFVLDQEGDMDAILHAIRGLGGTVIKTNVDLERAKLIQSTLTGSATTTTQSDGQ